MNIRLQSNTRTSERSSIETARRRTTSPGQPARQSVSKQTNAAKTLFSRVKQALIGRSRPTTTARTSLSTSSRSSASSASSASITSLELTGATETDSSLNKLAKKSENKQIIMHDKKVGMGNVVESDLDAYSFSSTESRENRKLMNDFIHSKAAESPEALESCIDFGNDFQSITLKDNGTEVTLKFDSKDDRNNALFQLLGATEQHSISSDTDGVNQSKFQQIVTVLDNKLQDGENQEAPIAKQLSKKAERQRLVSNTFHYTTNAVVKLASNALTGGIAPASGFAVVSDSLATSASRVGAGKTNKLGKLFRSSGLKRSRQFVNQNTTVATGLKGNYSSQFNSFIGLGSNKQTVINNRQKYNDSVRKHIDKDNNCSSISRREEKFKTICKNLPQPLNEGTIKLNKGTEEGINISEIEKAFTPGEENKIDKNELENQLTEFLNQVDVNEPNNQALLQAIISLASSPDDNILGKMVKSDMKITNKKGKELKGLDACAKLISADVLDIASVGCEPPASSLKSMSLKLTAALDKLENNVGSVGKNAIKLARGLTNFVGHAAYATAHSMTVGHFQDLAEAGKELKVAKDILVKVGTDPGGLQEEIKNECEELGISPEGNINHTINENINTIDKELKKLETDQKNIGQLNVSKLASKRSTNKKKIARLKDKKAKLETLKEKNTMSKMTNSQLAAKVADKTLNVTAAVGNSMWMVGFVGSLAFPPLGVVGCLGGAIFLSSKIVKAVNNFAARGSASLNNTDKANLTKSLKNINNNLNSLSSDKTINAASKLMEALEKGDSTAIQDAQTELKGAAKDSGEDIESLTGNINKLLNSAEFEKMQITSEESTNGFRDGLLDVANIVNWGFTIYGLGGAGGALMSGDGMGAAMDTLVGQFTGATESQGTSDNTFSSQIVNSGNVDFSSLQTEISNLNGESMLSSLKNLSSTITENLTLIGEGGHAGGEGQQAVLGDILTEYPLFALEGDVFNRDNIDSTISSLTAKKDDKPKTSPNEVTATIVNVKEDNSGPLPQARVKQEERQSFIVDIHQL